MPKISEDPVVPYWRLVDGRAEIYVGDCVRVMKDWSPNVNLLFADPPFNISHPYDVYKDNKAKQVYLNWTREWVAACKRVLSSTGSFWVAIGNYIQADVKKILDEAGLYWRDTIAWVYTFGPHQRGKFTPSWVALHYYTMHPTKYVWNQEAIKVPSARQLKYNDKRAKAGGKTPDNVWILDPSQYPEDCYREDDNAWLESRVCGTFKERTEHCAQMPVSVLDRIIKVSSNEGNLVCDPFLGSGTSMESALQNNRKCWGVELSENYVKNICIPRINSLVDPFATEHMDVST